MSAPRSVFQKFIRSFRTTSAKRSDHGPEGFPGANLPLYINNRYVVLVTFILFFGSGISVPFLILRHHLTR